MSKAHIQQWGRLLRTKVSCVPQATRTSLDPSGRALSTEHRWTLSDPRPLPTAPPRWTAPDPGGEKKSNLKEPADRAYQTCPPSPGFPAFRLSGFPEPLSLGLSSQRRDSSPQALTDCHHVQKYDSAARSTLPTKPRGGDYNTQSSPGCEIAQP